MVLSPCAVYSLWASSSRTSAITVAPVPLNKRSWSLWCERTDSNGDATDISSREMAQRRVPGTTSRLSMRLPGQGRGAALDGKVPDRLLSSFVCHYNVRDPSCVDGSVGGRCRC